MSELFLEIVTPSKTSFSGPVYSVTVPGSKGEFQVLVNHAPIMSTFTVGKVTVKDKNKNETIYATSGGVIEVKENKVLVLADSIESQSEIDKARAERAAERARKRLSNRGSDVDLLRAEASLARALNRLKLAK